MAEVESGGRKWMSGAEVEEKYKKMQSERCAAEIADIMDRSIDGVRYQTITQNEDRLNVMLFHFTKYGLVLEVLLPKLYPVDAPIATFCDGIPKHPDVDQETGRVKRFMKVMAEEEKWNLDIKIRDLVAIVADMLARVNTPLAPPPFDLQRDPDGRRHNLCLSPKEFSFLCKGGMGFIDGLKHEYGQQCKIKFRSSKNSDEGPGLILDSSSTECVERVMAKLHDHLVRKGFRRLQMTPRRGEPTEADDTLAFFTFSPTSGEGDAKADLMSFEESEKLDIAAGGTSKKTKDSWDAYAVLFPISNKKPEVPKGTIQYTRADMARARDHLIAMFEKFNLKRSLVWGKISAELKKQEVKLDRIEGKYRRVAMEIDRQKRTIQFQRRAMAARQQEVRQRQEQLDRYTCMICMNRDKDTAFQCGHMLCNECAINLQSAGRDCPMCRIKITAVLKVD